MNTLFRICVYYCIALLVFTLSFNMVNATGAFPIQPGPGIQDVTDDNIFNQITDIRSGMSGILLGFTVLSLSLVVLLAWAFHSMIPIGIYMFGMIFWASFIMAWGVFTDTGFFNEIQELMFIFAGVTAFLFIGACIGMSTGSG